MDLALLPFAAWALTALLQSARKLIRAAVTTVLLVALGTLQFSNILTRQPSLPPVLFDEILSLQRLPPDSKVLVTDSYYGPWVYGYSNQTAIAPGLFHDEWTYEQWVIYWSADANKKALLLKHHEPPLYIFSTNTRPDEYASPCFDQQSRYVIAFRCSE